ncbi:MAG TPA: adenylosuccinate synthase [Clostridiales bacterium]|jgi:adenylosuccinate synthase|nr:adenylosuccinate synthase [Clostridiales bacterium]
MIRAIVGANWGDEGKGKLTDVLAEQTDLVVRFQGGANAGHTIINEYGKFALHLLPSGIFHPEVLNIIGPGVALDPTAFLGELNSVLSRGIRHPRLCISDRAQVLMDFHVLLDTLEEERLGKNKFGSTKSGIAPFYSDKFAKVGIQVSQLMDKDLLHERLVNSLVKKNVLMAHLYHHAPLDADELTEKYYALGQQLKPWVQDTTWMLHDAVKTGKRILLEGQLGALRDPDHGIYPYTTSSSPLAGYAAVGAGVPPWAITEVIAVTKAYSSSVGTGVFPSCITGDEAEELRKRGGDAGEYGAKTGRPRDVGWFDAVATRHGCLVQGATDVAMTNLDVLSYLDEIPVCVAYELDGERIDHFPATPSLKRVKPIYETFPGWKTDIRGETQYENLPSACRQYVERIERLIDTPITILSTGPRREEICYRAK